MPDHVFLIHYNLLGKYEPFSLDEVLGIRTFDLYAKEFENSTLIPAKTGAVTHIRIQGETFLQRYIFNYISLYSLHTEYQFFHYFVFAHLKICFKKNTIHILNEK